MSRIRTGHKPTDWIDMGPTGCRTNPSHYIHGSLVVGGPVTGPVMGFFGKGGNRPKEEIEELRQKFHPHGKGWAA